MSELVVIYADGNTFSGQVSSLLCDHVVGRNVTVSLKNNHFSCYQEKCWGNNMAVTSRLLGDTLLGCHPTQAPTTSPPSKTPTLAPTAESKLTVRSASLSPGLLVAIIVPVVGVLLLFILLVVIWRRLMRKKYVIRRQREQRLQQLPIHRALLSRQIYTNAEFMELLDNYIDTARELDYDENTAIDIVLRSQNRITVSAEAIAMLLDDTIPPMHATLHVKRYELQSGAPLHESVTSLVIKAVDHGEYGWDEDPLDASGCKPNAPEVVVNAVELKLREHLDREGLGSPYKDEETAASILQQVLSNQGNFIEGELCAAVEDVCTNIKKMVKVIE
eukprot:gene1882-2217_t